MIRRSPFRRRVGQPPTHGGHMLRVLRTVSLDTIDRRSRIGVALRRIQEDLTSQLGGVEQVTPAQALMGLPMGTADLALFERCTGRTVAPTRPHSRPSPGPTQRRRAGAGLAPWETRSPRPGASRPRSITPDLRLALPRSGCRGTRSLERRGRGR